MAVIMLGYALLLPFYQRLRMTSKKKKKNKVCSVRRQASGGRDAMLKNREPAPIETVHISRPASISGFKPAESD